MGRFQTGDDALASAQSPELTECRLTCLLFSLEEIQYHPRDGLVNGLPLYGMRIKAKSRQERNGQHRNDQEAKPIRLEIVLLRDFW